MGVGEVGEGGGNLLRRLHQGSCSCLRWGAQLFASHDVLAACKETSSNLCQPLLTVTLTSLVCHPLLRHSLLCCSPFFPSLICCSP